MKMICLVFSPSTISAPIFMKLSVQPAFCQDFSKDDVIVTREIHGVSQ